jgi:hypothetical protein
MDYAGVVSNATITAMAAAEDEFSRVEEKGMSKSQAMGGIPLSQAPAPSHVEKSA